MKHTKESNNNALKTTVLFFLPPYVIYESLGEYSQQCNCVYNFSSILKFEVFIFFCFKILYFEFLLTLTEKCGSLDFETKINCQFTVLIDPNNTYSSIVKASNFGSPKTINIPYTTSAEKNYR